MTQQVTIYTDGDEHAVDFVAGKKVAAYVKDAGITLVEDYKYFVDDAEVSGDYVLEGDDNFEIYVGADAENG